MRLFLNGSFLDNDRGAEFEHLCFRTTLDLLYSENSLLGIGNLPVLAKPIAENRLHPCANELNALNPLSTAVPFWGLLEI